MANNDYGFQELLDILKKNPELIRELVFDATSIQALLKNKAAQKLAEGVDAPQVVDVPTFLNYVAGPDDGFPVAHYSPQTQTLCAKGTRFEILSCAGGTSK
jgi:hypothetical protein